MKVSAYHKKILEFMALGHLLIRSYGLGAGVNWNGGAQGPKVRYDTADKLIDAGLIEEVESKRKHWGRYYRLSKAGQNTPPRSPVEPR